MSIVSARYSNPQKTAIEAVRKDRGAFMTVKGDKDWQRVLDCGVAIEPYRGPTYAEKRREEYPPIGDQLDALWKELNYRRINGDPLTQEADNILNKILDVKAKHPKPEEV